MGRCGFRLASLWRDSRGGCLYVIRFLLHHVFYGDICREPEGAIAEIHRVAKRHYAADDGRCPPFMLFRRALHGFADRNYFARWLAAGDRPGVRRAHHHALEHGLSADQCLFATLERGKKPKGYKKKQENSIGT